MCIRSFFSLLLFLLTCLKYARKLEHILLSLMNDFSLVRLATWAPFYFLGFCRDLYWCYNLIFAYNFPFSISHNSCFKSVLTLENILEGVKACNVQHQGTSNALRMMCYQKMKRSRIYAYFCFYFIHTLNML